MSMKMLITDAGLAEVVNAEQSGTAPVVLSHIAFGTGQYTPTADMTALKSEFKRFDSIKGGAIADNVIHISVHDTDKQAYTVYEVGVFTESGTLFAVSSQTTPIVQKAEDAEVMLVTDFVLSDIDVDSITIGDTNFILNPATTETAGIVALATEAEAKAGTDATKAITPAALKAKVDNYDTGVVHKAGTETISGAKTFTYGSIVLKSNSIDPSTAPSSDKYANYAIYDKDGNWLGVVGAQQNASDNGTSMRFQVIRKINGETKWGASLQCIMTADGATYTYAPHPDSSNNTASNKIATVGFVSDPAKSTNIVHRTGDESITGSKTFASTLKFNNTVALCKTNTSDAIRIDGGTDYTNGAFLALHGKDGSATGGFELSANDGTNRRNLVGKPDGVLTWNDKNITLEGDCLPVSGGAMTTTKAMTRDVNNSFLGLHGGTGENNDGAQLYLCGSNHSSSPSAFQLHARNSSIDKVLEGKVDGTLEWDGKRVLNNSFLMPTDGGAVMLTAGTSSAGGAYFRLYGKDHSSGEGQFVLATTDGESTNALVGKPDGTLTWNGKSIVIDPGITALTATSGAVSLAINKIYTISVSDATTFSLPTVSDTSVFNQIKVMMKVTGTPIIDWGTTYFFNKTTPEIEEGSYDVYFDYDNLLGAWVCGVMSKGVAE